MKVAIKSFLAHVLYIFLVFVFLSRALHDKTNNNSCNVETKGVNNETQNIIKYVYYIYIYICIVGLKLINNLCTVHAC